jgi:hypothetical protein
MRRAGRLSQRGSSIQPRTTADTRQVIAELEAAMTADKQTTVAMAAAYKSMHDGHRYDSDSKVMAIDNCCSKCITNDLTDFIETPTQVNMRVQGIGGTVTATLCGTVRWDIEDDDGISHQQIIPGTYYNPDSKYKLYSPQHVAQVANDNHPRPHGTVRNVRRLSGPTVESAQVHAHRTSRQEDERGTDEVRIGLPEVRCILQHGVRGRTAGGVFTHQSHRSEPN